MTQPQQESPAWNAEYIIRSDELESLLECLHEQRRMTFKNGIEKAIRSRPHTSTPADDPIMLNTQPEGCDCRDCQRYQKDECPYPGSNPTIYICNSFIMDVKQHDTAIRNAARDARDIDWSTALNTLIATESVRLSPTMVNMTYSYRIAQIIEQLRTQQEQP
jgi:hypothetical protein